MNFYYIKIITLWYVKKRQYKNATVIYRTNFVRYMVLCVEPQTTSLSAVAPLSLTEEREREYGARTVS